MKKIIAAIFGFCCFAFSAAAGDKEVWQQVYRLLQDKYIDKAELSSLFVPSVNALSKIDKNVRVVLEKNSAAVYYNNKLYKIYSRPDDEYDAEKWADLTVYLLEELKKLSPQLQHKDFELTEVMLYNGLHGFDKHARYYPVLEIGQEQEKIQGYNSNILDGGILYIRLGTINDYTFERFQESMQKQADVNGIILDLRGNKGGYLKQALEIADSFLHEGKIIYTVGKEAGKRKTYTAHSGDYYHNVPMVVLVDGKTASSAEVLALALKEHGRAKLVGAQTFGKASVQNIYKLENGAYMSLTTERFFSPRGIPVEETGVRPNVCSEVFQTTSDIDELIAYPYNFMCPKLSRYSTFDLDVALRVLQNDIKAGLQKEKSETPNSSL